MQMFQLKLICVCYFMSVYVLLIVDINTYPYYISFNEASWKCLFAPPTFFRFTQTFRIFGHAIVYFRLKGNIIKAFRFSVTLLAPLFAKLIQHIWFGVYQVYVYKAYLLGKFSPKIPNCQFKLKFGALTNSNLHNSIVMFTFSVFDRKYSFRANFIPKFKIVSLVEIWYLD